MPNDDSSNCEKHANPEQLAIFVRFIASRLSGLAVRPNGVILGDLLDEFNAFGRSHELWRPPIDLPEIEIPDLTYRQVATMMAHLLLEIAEGIAPYIMNCDDELSTQMKKFLACLKKLGIEPAGWGTGDGDLVWCPGERQFKTDCRM